MVTSTIPGADCGSYHVPVVAHLQLNLKKLKNKAHHIRYDWKAFDSNEKLKEEYKETLIN